jgi:hypothetical protein
MHDDCLFNIKTRTDAFGCLCAAVYRYVAFIVHDLELLAIELNAERVQGAFDTSDLQLRDVYAVVE